MVELGATVEDTVEFAEDDADTVEDTVLLVADADTVGDEDEADDPVLLALAVDVEASW
jgi:hypothetical protein